MEARTHMKYAGRGKIADATKFVAEREELEPAAIREEVAAQTGSYRPCLTKA
jgi:thiamine biosynthesis protein ThiC